MDVRQIYEIVNDTFNEVMGTETLTVDEDLRNIVDIGSAVFNSNSVDHFVRSLVDHVGRVYFVNRKYTGIMPSLDRTEWEFGAVLEKIRVDIPEAEENESWSLTDRTVYEQDMFYKPSVSVKFYDKMTTFEVPMSFTEMQLKSAFSNIGQLNSFLSMLYNAVDTAIVVANDNLKIRVINSMIADTVYDDYAGAGIDSKSGVKAVNLLYKYNHAVFSSSSDYITAAQAITDPDFIRFASVEIMKYATRLKVISKLFNVGGTAKFTSPDRLGVVMLSDFADGAKGYLYSDTFNEEYVKLPNADVIPYWQGPGTAYAFSDTGTIDVISASNNNQKVTGVLAVLFDKDACGIANYNRRTTSHYNAKAEFYSNWGKVDGRYYCDLDENFVVFFVA